MDYQPATKIFQIRHPAVHKKLESKDNRSITSHLQHNDCEDSIELKQHHQVN